MAWSWIDGRLVPEEEARVAVLDRGFLYGDGIFETLRLRAGKPILFAGHIQRMLMAADEAFLTNAVLGVAPLVCIDGRPIAGGQPGPLTRLAQKWYDDEIMLDDGEGSRAGRGG